MLRQDIIHKYGITLELDTKENHSDLRNLERALYHLTLNEIPGGKKFESVQFQSNAFLKKFKNTKSEILNFHFSKENNRDHEKSVIETYAENSLSLSSLAAYSQQNPSDYTRLIKRLKSDDIPEIQIKPLEETDIKLCVDFSIDNNAIIAIDCSKGLRIFQSAINRIELRKTAFQEFTPRATVYMETGNLMAEVAPQNFKVFTSGIYGSAANDRNLAHHDVIACHFNSDVVDKAVSRYLRTKFAEYASGFQLFREAAPLETLTATLDGMQRLEP